MCIIYTTYLRDFSYCWMVFELSTAVCAHMSAFPCRHPFRKVCILAKMLALHQSDNQHMFTELVPICQALWWGSRGGGGRRQRWLSSHSWPQGPHRLIGRKCQKPRRWERQISDHNRRLKHKAGCNCEPDVAKRHRGKMS